MNDRKLDYKKKIEKTIKINNKIFDYLSKYIKCDIDYWESDYIDFKISDKSKFSIILRNSIYKKISLYLDYRCIDSKDVFILMMEKVANQNIDKPYKPWKKIPYLSLDKIESDDFLEFVKNEIFDFAEFNKANKIYEQLTLF